METITLAGGCFWCVETAFSSLRGVASAVSGYAGGHLPHPTYQQVCAGDTGHAEVVQVTFDPQVIPRRIILEVFFSIHDPTQLNRQGEDIGTQYRSAIFYHSAEQRLLAASVMADVAAAGYWDGEIVTRIEPFAGFWPAEIDHQGYFPVHPENPYCQLVVAPKVAKFRQKFQGWLKG
jgi:peptide-methionine (S)-S-oxide reductase